MAISLTKGGNVNLSKEAPNLTNMAVGLGWNPRATDGQAFDLDAVAFLVNESGKVRADADFIFFNNLKSSDGSVEHTGDNRTGEGDGDDEVIKVDLSKVPADVSKVVFCAVIYEGQARNQNFGQVANAYIRIVNTQGGAEVARYDLSEDSSTETAMIFGELYKNNGEWKFRAVGQGFAGGLGPLAASYGVAV
ncbi:chemical-damaging agent resistance protein C [Moraxella osloensis]|uniref:General stress protein 16U n=1 Tax=Faucicola osloensis TaxID=34062 RepID=A0A378Q6S1_FAUOS|nr:TerD family protein [Moraxella osloensis]AME01334.1 chemical-damaging agent resistance protein C [Moraxella osloensis]OBX52069.1 chemical-damaging agent resistance protein C [Moraxella osloensis]QPT42932.1 TerD family protein [Moraxella osloensis]STY96533.1 General stress protein 16U [Moraxella osloensis]